MCQTVNALILCTCEIPEKRPNEYWILHRYVKRKPEYILGLPCMPLLGSKLIKYNEMSSWILKTLNKQYCFDKEIEIKAMDVLRITLKGFGDTFEFKYNGKSWFKYRNKFSFELMNNYEEIKQGKIKAHQTAFLK